MNEYDTLAFLLILAVAVAASPPDTDLAALMSGFAIVFAEFFVVRQVLWLLFSSLPRRHGESEAQTRTD